MATEYKKVTMADGRVVTFAGKRKVNQEVLIDASKVVKEGETVGFLPGAVSVRFDFLSGISKVITPPPSAYPQFLGHGIAQKYRTELYGSGDKEPTTNELLEALNALDAKIAKGVWGREPANPSSIPIIIRAIMEVTGKPQEDVRAFIKRKLEESKKLPAGQRLTREELYESFRRPGTKTGIVIRRLEEEEKAKKAAAIDVDAELAAL
jgi:hypothetical protein